MDWTKYQTIRWAYKVEDWHDGGFSYHERHGCSICPMSQLSISVRSTS